MNIDFGDRKVLITGGASGLGLTIAKTFVSGGAMVCVCDMDEDAVNHIKKTESQIQAFVADISNCADATHFVQNAAQAMGGLNVVVNNAGISGPTSSPEDVSIEDWQRVMSVNVTGSFHITKAAIDYLKDAKSASIINMSSIAADKGGYPNRLPYATSKMAMIGFSETLAMDLGRYNINVNTVLPGGLEGQRLKSVISRAAQARGVSFDEECKNLVTENSMRIVVSKQDVANLVCFLCSQQGHHISGQKICVDGNNEGERSYSDNESMPTMPDVALWSD